jgi:hypothetical protein
MDFTPGDVEESHARPPCAFDCQHGWRGMFGRRRGWLGRLHLMRWFLSYHSPDQALAERLKAAIERKDSTSRVFFAPTHMRAGGFWSAQLAQERSFSPSEPTSHIDD